MTQRTLSQALRVSPRNVTGLLDALEAGGYVTRGRHPTDRRAQLMGVASDATDSEIDRAWAQGRAMSLEDAVASVRTFRSPAAEDLLAGRAAATQHVKGRQPPG